MSDSEAIAKLAASKSKSQRGAVVHNYAYAHELNHTLKTIDSIKVKAHRSLNFDQKKFLESLSLSNEDLRKGGTRKYSKYNLGAYDTNIEVEVTGGSSQELSTIHASMQTDLLGVQSDEFIRSASDLDLYTSPTSVSSIPLRSRTYSEGPRTKIGMTTRDKEKDDDICDPYSISCSMKISQSRGSFETSTGKTGLNAWMGKRPSLKTRKKDLY